MDDVGSAHFLPDALFKHACMAATFWQSIIQDDLELYAIICPTGNNTMALNQR